MLKEHNHKQELPFPPEKFRKLVGPIELDHYDNPNRLFTFGDLAVGPLEAGEAYNRVFDFGCGCGRNARQLFLQYTPPKRYVGVDINREMIEWCKSNLTVPNIDVNFYHHDVWNLTYAPENSKNLTQPIDQYGKDFTLINAHSVFTHLYEAQTIFYLKQFLGMLSNHGIIRSTWFFFNRDWFLPVLAPYQHCIYVNEIDPTQAVYYDWNYFLEMIHEIGLRIISVIWASVPGGQNAIFLAKSPEFQDIADELIVPSTILGFQDSRPLLQQNHA